MILRLVTLAVRVASAAHADLRAIDARVRVYVDTGLFTGVVLMSSSSGLPF